MASADLVVRNGTVRTMDPDRPVSSAMAVDDGLIVAIGDDRDIDAYIDETTSVINLHGATVLPGLIDAHNHHHLAGEEDLFRVSFAPDATVDAICAAVAGWIATQQLAPGEWVLGGNWGSTLVGTLGSSDALTRLDAVSPAHPVLLSDDSHHNRWVNSAAMRAAGIDARTDDPEGGRIVRDERGEPTGLLFETAAGAVEQRVVNDQGIDIDRLARSSERALEMMHAFGITAFQDASTSLGLLQALHRLSEDGRLTSWAVTSMLVNDTILGNTQVGEELLPYGEHYRTQRHRPDFTKIFLDGVPPTHTAALLQPYRATGEHGAEHTGTPVMTFDELLAWVRLIDDRGLGVKVHCTGDASVRLVLDVVEAARAEGRRLIVHIAHGQLIHPDDIARFASLGVVAEISPFLWYPGVIPQALHEVLPDELSARIHPNRDLLDAGALLVAGSDWPVSESPNPWHAISGLVTRRDPTGRTPGALWPEQGISVIEALRAFTTTSADALGLADVTGRLTPGLSADFIMIDADPLSIPSSALADIVTGQTWFAGEKVYDRSDHPARASAPPRSTR
ncbi:amidohydrolase [Microbacterium sp. kSW2-24]|uniref:amidohydrolase n=1 Tax=Microbacterium galbinum TaxID=2851646 RepID=UPI001FFC8908|nr:amidohydrolase [Microbacterium galbinum]MCK2023342.1 amidohydrolase [Microbacterium galbinum]